MSQRFDAHKGLEAVRFLVASRVGLGVMIPAVVMSVLLPEPFKLAPLLIGMAIVISVFRSRSASSPFGLPRREGDEADRGE
jgi:hypothetical protein